MAATGHRTIAIKTNQVHVFRGEGIAGEAGILPGELITGPDTALLAHDGGIASPKKIALEADYARNESDLTANRIDIAYANGDQVYYALAQPGEVYYMWLADGQTTAVGSALIATTAGQLTVTTVDASTLEGALVGLAKEVVAASGAAARVLVEIA